VEGSWFKDRLTTELTLHGGTIDNYIYLRPSGYRLTIRGAFPVFDYVATDATLYGTDMTLTYAIQGPWSVRSRFTLVRGWDRTLQDHLFLMPADRWENAVLYEQDSVGTWNGLQAALTSTWVAEQLRVPLGVDFTDPPPAYHLLGASLSMSRPVGASEMRFGVLASNLLNVAYRDYLDRFRYYADARGVDVSLWLRFSFGNTRSRR
jgi:iron complex outermembrane receptor protein